MNKKTVGTNRRDFLKLAGTTTAEAQPVDLASETMQDTAHTRAYLDSARF